MYYKQSIKEKLLRGGAWAFVGKLFTAMAVLIINSLLARLLSPEDMGAYFLTFSLVLLVTTIAQLGLTQSIVRFVAESMGEGNPGKARKSVVLSLRLAALGAGAGACFITFGGGQWVAERIFDSSAISSVIGLAGVWVIIITFQQLMAEVYRGFHDIRLATIFGGLVTSVLSMLLFTVLWFWQGGAGLYQIVLLALLAGLSSVLVSSVFLWHKLESISSVDSSESEASLRVIMITSWPLLVSNITFLLLSQADLWIVGAFCSPANVATYGAALRMVALITMPLLIVNAVVPPLIAEMFAQKKITELEKALRLVCSLAAFPALVLLGLFVFNGDFILGLVFGDYYKGAAVVLAILSVGQLVNVWVGSCGQVLMLTGYQISMMVITLVSGSMMVLLAYAMVEPYGVVGVASASAMGMILQNVLMLFYVKNKVGIWTHISLNHLIAIIQRKSRNDI